MSEKSCNLVTSFFDSVLQGMESLTESLVRKPSKEVLY